MRRREFITLVGGAAVAWPLAARAQQSGMPLVAHLSVGTLDANASRVAAFRKGLSETGYAEGQNVLVEYHWLEGYQGFTAILDDLLRRRVAVIAIPGNTPVSLAAKQAITTIPIVFGVAENPVTLGLVTSLARPGGNATGINFITVETNDKRLELMHELLPKAARIAVLINPANVRYSEATSTSLRKAAPSLGVEIVFFNSSTPGEIDAAFAAMVRERTDALFIAGDGFFASRSVQLATLAARERIPTSGGNREMVQAGLLMSYGTNLSDMERQVGIYAGSILTGAKPADLPVIQATKFEFVINLQTAKSLGIEVSPMLLALTDHVIE